MTIADLGKAYHAAYDAHMALLAALPVYRSPEQQAQLDAAYMAVENARWEWESAEFWEHYYKRQA